MHRKEEKREKMALMLFQLDRIWPNATQLCQIHLGGVMLDLVEHNPSGSGYKIHKYEIGDITSF